MKKSPGFVSAFLYISLFCLVWLGGYAGLREAFHVKTKQAVKPPQIQEEERELPTPFPACFTILAVTGEEKPEELEKLFLFYTDFLRDTMTVIEIPVNTKTELSPAAHEVLSFHRPEMPSLLMLTELYHLFPEKSFCMASEEVLQDITGVRPKACYVIPETLFQKFSDTGKESTDFFLPENLRELLLSIHEKGSTDRQTEEDLIYYESYLDLKELKTEKLAGKEETILFQPDMEKIRERILEIQAGS